LLIGPFIVDRVVFATSGQHIDVALLRTFWGSRSVAGSVIREFVPTVWPLLVATSFLALAMAWPSRRGLRTSWGVLPAAAFVLIPIQYKAWNGTVDGYPSPFVVAARGAWIVIRPVSNNDLPLKSPSLAAARKLGRPAEHIVFVMDESIRSDYLTINNAALDTTPFVAQSSHRIANFGSAVSATNCSISSRWMMRRGVRPWQLPNLPAIDASMDGITNGPRTSIWQFAKAAGFQTVYLDPWKGRYGDEHSGFTKEEFGYIDERIPIDGPMFERDAKAARVLVGLLKRQEPLFIYVDKAGAHFPYDDDYPGDFQRYTRPDGTPFVWSRRTRDDAVGSYKNAVAWSVDGFFRTLLLDGDLSKATLVYTSDHAERLWDEGGIFWRHCDDHPPLVEVEVPLFAISGDADIADALRASAKRSFGSASHFDIFTTLLTLMGFEPGQVAAAYGPSLFNIPSDRDRQFVTGDVIGHESRHWFDVPPADSAAQ